MASAQFFLEDAEVLVRPHLQAFGGPEGGDVVGRNPGRFQDIEILRHPAERLQQELINAGVLMLALDADREDNERPDPLPGPEEAQILERTNSASAPSEQRVDVEDAVGG